MIEITSESKYMDLLNAFPLLKTDLPIKNPKFKFLVTPMGKITLWDANLSQVSEQVDMSVCDTVDLFNRLIKTYKVVL